jgi:hypothetical protein
MGSKQKRQLWSLMFFLFFIAAVFVPLVGAATPKTGSANTHFYVACRDKRIYTIDVNWGQVVAVSEPISELGNPSSLDISRDGRTLYISSEWPHGKGKRQDDYFPIVVVDASTMQVKRKFLLEMRQFNPNRLNNIPVSVYRLRVSPDGKTIFAMFPHPKYQGGNVAVDAETGAILRQLPGFFVDYNQQNCTFSDDGRFATRIWSARGKIYNKTYDLETGEKVASIPAQDLFASGQSLNPLWRRVDGPLSVIHSKKRDVPRENENPVQYILRTIDRMTGEVLLELDAGTPVFYSDSNQAILSRGISSVVRVDLRTGIFDAPIPVGEYPTNVVSVTGQ